MRERTGKPTIRDVGREAGVSYAAASYVLSGSKYAERITPATKQRIFDAATRLGYVRSTVGAALTRGYLDTVVLLVVSWDIITSLADLTIRLSQAAARQGLTTIVHIANDDTDANAFLRTAPSLHPYGMLLLWDSTAVASDQLAYIQSLGIPVADLMPAGPTCSAVVTADREEAFYLLGRHLAELGHREIGVVDDFSLYSRTTGPKLAGLRRGLGESGVTLQLDLMEQSEGDVYQIGYNGAVHLLTRRPDTTAIVSLSDRSALAAVAAIRGMGLRVPEDISITGYGAHADSRFATPPLTTVSASDTQIASAALDVLTKARAGLPVEPRIQAVGPVQLVIGGSAGPVRTWEVNIQQIDGLIVP